MGARVLVCGGRGFTGRVWLWGMLDLIRRDRGIACVIEGGAAGADALAREWAEGVHIPVLTFLPDWETHGRKAGPMRNAQMLAEGKPDLVLAFPGGRGTADMVRQAKAAGVAVSRMNVTELPAAGAR